MRLFSPEHLGPVLAIVAITSLLALAAHRRPGPWVDTTGRGLAVVLVLSELVYILGQLARHQWSAVTDIPIQLSDVATLASAAALWWRTPILVELTYFWGLGAVLQAILTPDLAQHFPDPNYFLFYIGHGGVLAAALLLTAGLHIWPRPGAPTRVFLLTLAYAGLIAVVDWLTGWNYMYLRAKPAAGSLLNLFGPWPWYIGGGLCLALIFLAVLNLPFWWLRRRSTGISSA